jgi:hypothetical protein
LLRDNRVEKCPVKISTNSTYLVPKGKWGLFNV